MKSWLHDSFHFAANDIFEFSNEHKMKLNPSKCNEMLINFMSNHNFVINPIILGNNVIERISTYKILGVYISSDLKWDYHIDYIVKKANKRLFPKDPKAMRCHAGSISQSICYNSASYFRICCPCLAEYS